MSNFRGAFHFERSSKIVQIKGNTKYNSKKEAPAHADASSEIISI